jgi:hypothetical protein
LNYRRIYEEEFGPIPVDDEGRTFDIHHIDGDRTNNSPENLVALSIGDHYQLHLSQGDFAAAHAILLRMRYSISEISRLASAGAKARILRGCHHFVGGDIQRRNVRQRVLEGTHHFLRPEHRVNVSIRNKESVDNGNHPFQRPECRRRVIEWNSRMLESGEHPFTRGIGAAETRLRIAQGTHHFQNSEVQRENSRKAVEKNGIRVQRICAYSRDVVLFDSIQDAVRSTAGATRRYIEAASRRGIQHVGYRWLVLETGVVPFNDLDIAEIQPDSTIFNRQGRPVKTASKVVRRWEVHTPDGVIYARNGTRVEICKEFSLSYSAVKDAKGREIKRGPSKGWRAIELPRK